MIRFLRSLVSLARSLFSLVAPAAIFALHLGVMLCFINRWDSLVVVTLVPIWAWAGLGMALSVVTWFIFKNRLLILTFAIWLATGIFCADESPGLFRAFMAAFEDSTEAPAESPNRLRIVTVNCSRGNVDAAKAASTHSPDIIFLQEAPEEGAGLQELTRELFGGEGSFLTRDRCAILARGTLTTLESEAEFSGVIATLKPPGMPPIELINLHLQRAIQRKDFWNPEAWQKFTSIRKSNRQTLRKTVESFPSHLTPVPQVVGGDFGTPANDDLYRMLRSYGYVDSFRTIGHGWGNTYTKGQPLLRIDQIWSSDRLKPVRSRVVVNSHSDHRMVVTDYELAGPGTKPGSR